MDPRNQTTAHRKPKLPHNRSNRRRNGVAERSGQHLPGARHTFISRTAAHNRQIADLKLTQAQKNALGAIGGTLTMPRISDATFSKLESYGLVKADTTRPHRAALTDLGMAYLRRAPKGGKR